MTLISRKMRRAIDSDLQPILCVGETLEERESGQFMEVVARQVVRGLADFTTCTGPAGDRL